MGFMTNITILNDHFDWVQKNPKKFVRAIASGMNSGTDRELWSPSRADYRTDEEREASVHYVTVHEAQHANTTQIIYTEANMALPVHMLAWGRAERWVNKWGKGTENARVRIGILRRVVNDLRIHADRLEAELDAIAEVPKS